MKKTKKFCESYSEKVQFFESYSGKRVQFFASYSRKKGSILCVILTKKMCVIFKKKGSILCVILKKGPILCVIVKEKGFQFFASYSKKKASILCVVFRENQFFESYWQKRVQFLESYEKEKLQLFEFIKDSFPNKKSSILWVFFFGNGLIFHEFFFQKKFQYFE